MKSKLFLIVFTVLLSVNNIISQRFIPRNSGIDGVFTNPANIAGGTYKWDVNVIRINAIVASDTTINLKKLTIKDIFGTKDGLNTLNLMANLDIQMPSFMLNISDRDAIAFTTRVRATGNVMNLDPRIVGNIMEVYNKDTKYPFNFKYDYNQGFNVNMWGEIGFTWARVLVDKDEHFIKGGITAKYLIGGGNMYVKLDSVSGTVLVDNKDTKYLTKAAGRLTVVTGGINIDPDNLTDFTKSGTGGLGGEIGFVYEYRPDMPDYESSVSKYKFKAGLALLDLGFVKYKTNKKGSGIYKIHIDSDEFNLSQFEGKTIEYITNTMDNNKKLFTKTEVDQKYSVSLPTTIQANLDYNFGYGFFTELAGQFAFKDTKKLKSPYYANTIALIPRYERDFYAFFLPVSYNQLSNFKLGFGFICGPLFVSSNSLLSAAFKTTKQIDLQAGIKFGF